MRVSHIIHSSHLAYNTLAHTRSRLQCCIAVAGTLVGVSVASVASMISSSTTSSLITCRHMSRSAHRIPALSRQHRRSCEAHLGTRSPPTVCLLHLACEGCRADCWPAPQHTSHRSADHQDTHSAQHRVLAVRAVRLVAWVQGVWGAAGLAASFLQVGCEARDLVGLAQGRHWLGMSDDSRDSRRTSRRRPTGQADRAGPG